MERRERGKYLSYSVVSYAEFKQPLSMNWHVDRMIIEHNWKDSMFVFHRLCPPLIESSPCHLNNKEFSLPDNVDSPTRRTTQDIHLFLKWMEKSLTEWVLLLFLPRPQHHWFDLDPHIHRSLPCWHAFRQYDQQCSDMQPWMANDTIDYTGPRQGRGRRDEYLDARKTNIIVAKNNDRDSQLLDKKDLEEEDFKTKKNWNRRDPNFRLSRGFVNGVGRCWFSHSVSICSVLT